MPVDPKIYKEVDKRFPASMAGDGGRILTVKNDESGYEHNPGIVFETLVGAIIMWPLDPPPQGYLICDGAEYDEAAYPALAALLGTYDVNGVMKFKVPNIVFPKNSKGVNTGTEEPESVGTHGHGLDASGAHDHAITVDAVANHGHSLSGSGTHQHVLDRPMFFSSGSYTDWGFDNVSNRMGPTYTKVDGGHSHSISAGGAHTHIARSAMDGGHDHKLRDHTAAINQPPCTLLTFCIRT